MKFKLWDKRQWKKETIYVGIFAILVTILIFMIYKLETSRIMYSSIQEAFAITNKIKQCESYFVKNKNLYCVMKDGSIFGGDIKYVYRTTNRYANTISAIAVAKELLDSGKLTQYDFNLFVQEVLDATEFPTSP